MNGGTNQGRFCSETGNQIDYNIFLLHFKFYNINKECCNCRSDRTFELCEDHAKLYGLPDWK